MTSVTQMPPEQNPSNTPAAGPMNPAAPAPRRRRIPMSVPTRKLEVPPMPGYYLYWFLQENIPRALQADYEFVNHNEVDLNRTSIAGSTDVSGNTDLGSHVSIVSGQNSQGQPQRLTLMKLRQELRDEDRALVADHNLKVIRAIFKDEQVIGKDGNLHGKERTQYVDKDRTSVSLLNRPTRKAKLNINQS